LKDEVEVQDLFLLFLPNFLMQSPFHHLIIAENYNLFNQTAKMAQKYFNDFPNSNDFINKITDMFIYILENVTSYPRSALKNIYCELPFYESDESPDSSEESDNEASSHNILKNIKMIEDFLAVIRVKVEADKRYSNRDDFNFEQL
jgi:hypothetical protein